jgi:hypothetical protein
MVDKGMKHVHKAGGGGGAVWFFGFVGALFYFTAQAHGLVDIIVAILKSIAWPAFFVFKFFEFLRV